MASQNSITINLPKSALKEKEGIVVMPLKKWRQIEEDLEDLEMYRSEGLSREISQRRAEKKTISLNTLLKKHHI